MYPKIEVDKATSITGCLNLPNRNMTSPFDTLTPAGYETVGILKLFHITFLLVPVIGFVISLSVALVTSLLTGLLIDI